MADRSRWVEAPRTFCVPVSRKAFGELSLDFVLIPALDAPVLVFSERDQAAASCLAARIDELRDILPRVRDPDRSRNLGTEAFKHHLTRVALAIGYTWPGNPPGYIEFAPDA